MSRRTATTATAVCNTRNITIPGDATYQYEYGYDAATGLLAHLQYPAAGTSAGLAVNYGYSYGALSSVTDASNGIVYWQGSPASVNALGEITQDTLGNGIVTQTTSTEVTGWPTKIISGPTAGSASVQNQTFSYDPLGNVTQRQDSNAGLTENFYYDADNRLTSSSLSNGSTTTTNLQLSYNPNGSIAQKNETGGADDPVAYNALQWTSYNYLRSINATLPGTGQTEGATFDYGPDRQRWRMVYTEGSANETTEYIGGLMQKVTSTDATDYRYYVYGSQGPAAIVHMDGSGTTTPYYVLEDQEGSISTLLNSTGTVAANESFTAFGSRREASTWAGPPSSAEEAVMDGITRQGFTGQTVLGQMELNHMNGRVEDAVTGTFLSPDPYVTDPTNTQDYYRYAYVYDNPLTDVDPSGFGTSPPEVPPLPETVINGTPLPGWVVLENMDVTVDSCPASCAAYFNSLGGGGGGSGQNNYQTAPQLQQQTNCSDPYVCLPPKPNCNSVLPNGSTIGSNVQQVNSSIDQTEISVAEAGGDPTAAGMGVYLGSVGSNGPLDFKNNFRGQGNPGFLGEAGNFAFGAVSAHLFGSGSFGQYVALSGAGVYAMMAGKKGPGIPFLEAPYGADPSAQANTPAGVASSCPAP